MDLDELLTESLFKTKEQKEYKRIEKEYEKKFAVLRGDEIFSEVYDKLKKRMIQELEAVKEKYREPTGEVAANWSNSEIDRWLNLDSETLKAKIAQGNSKIGMRPATPVESRAHHARDILLNIADAHPEYSFKQAMKALEKELGTEALQMAIDNGDLPQDQEEYDHLFDED